MVGVCHSIDMQVEFLKFNPWQQVFSYKNSIRYIYTHANKMSVTNTTHIYKSRPCYKICFHGITADIWSFLMSFWICKSIYNGDGCMKISPRCLIFVLFRFISNKSSKVWSRARYILVFSSAGTCASQTEFVFFIQCDCPLTQKMEIWKLRC